MLTGFGSFLNFDTNPTTLLLEGFPDLPNGIALHKAILEVDADYLQQEYPRLLQKTQPDLIINTGLNAAAHTLQLETFAINSLKDKEAFSTVGRPAAFQTSIDTHALAQFLCAQGIPTQRSDYAGSYYCNYVYYLSLQWGVPSLFVHIPFFTEMMSKMILEKHKTYPSLPHKLVEKGLVTIIEVLRQPALP